MSKISGTQPPLHFIEPNFDLKSYYLSKLILPFRIRFATPIRKIQFENIEILSDLYTKFSQKKVRLLIAFRHPNANDPYLLGAIFWKLLPNYFKKNNIRINDITHFHFVWDRGIPLWAGEKTGNFYSKLGGTPIHRGKVDWKGLNSIRNLFVNGRFPLAIAPEGATNGHNEILSPLEPGIGQMALWCLEDLEKKNRNEEVYILPLGIQYSYIDPNWKKLETLLDEFLKDLNINTVTENIYLSQEFDSEKNRIYSKLYSIGISLLNIIEIFYKKYYGVFTQNDSTLPLQERLQNLLSNILSVSEKFFQISPKGTIIDRCRKLEQASWNWIYRDDIPEDISNLDKNLLDRIAVESKEMDWHMRIVESFVAVNGHYVKDKPTFERFSDVSFLFFDLISKIKTGSGQQRPTLGKYKVTLKAGDPILVNPYYYLHKQGRAGTKKAVDEILVVLENKMNSLIN